MAQNYLKCSYVILFYLVQILSAPEINVIDILITNCVEYTMCNDRLLDYMVGFYYNNNHFGILLISSFNHLIVRHTFLFCFPKLILRNKNCSIKDHYQ